MNDFQIKQTADGSSTIYMTDLDEPYHSLNGAMTESDHVFIQHGFLFRNKQQPVVLEVGFGTGLNCLLTAIKAEKLKWSVIYYTVENFPLGEQMISQLNYGSLIFPDAGEIFRQIHSCPWETEVQISDYFRLVKMKRDIVRDEWSLPGGCDVVYFDAFAPDKQPEMWTPRVFRHLFLLSLPDGIFVTYSAKGRVRRELATAGYHVERLAGPPGKKEMLRGIKLQVNH